MPQVFISHASEDKAFAEAEIIPLLKSFTIDTWYAADDIPSATLWENMIREGLESSDWFAALLSPNAYASRWVRAEIAWAVENRPNRIVPILIANCNPVDINLQLIHYQYVDFRNPTDCARQDLVAVWGKQLADVSMMELSIKVTCRELETERKLLISDAVTIGRHPECDIYIDSGAVSRRVAYIKTSERDGIPCLLLYDLGSRASATVNGKSIDHVWKLSPGDVVKIADVSIRVTGIRRVAVN